MPRALLLVVMLLVPLSVACGGDSRARSPGTDGGIDPPGDGGTTDRDSGDRMRDGGDPGEDSGVLCGEERCAARQACCVDCDGAPIGCADACPGIACPPDDCRTDADCTAAGTFEYCVPPGVPPACGVGCAMMRDCELHEDCGEGQRCVEMVGPCCTAADPLESRCMPACAPGGCPTGQRCNADAICEPLPCTEGYTCPAHTTCTGTGDDHGCARNPCVGDGDCPGGACVSGSCYDGPGTCMGPAA